MFANVKTPVKKAASRGPAVTFQGGQPVRKFYIGSSPTFAPRNTLNIMRAMILEGAKHYEVRQVAEQLVAGMTCNYDKGLAVWEFITEASNYQHDPLGFEYIKTPQLILDEIKSGIRPQLDCDDMAVLSLSMLMSVGVPVGLRAASYRPDKKLSHVYGVFYMPKRKKWVPLDCVNKHGGPGWEKKPYTKVLNWRIP